MSSTHSPEVDRRQRVALLFLALALLCLPIPIMSYHGDVKIAEWPREVSGFPAFRDFVNLWTGGHAVVTGAFEDLYVKARHTLEIERLLGITHEALAWSYPPTAMIPLVPLALMPYPIAVLLWCFVGVGLYLAALGVRDLRPETLTVLVATSLLPGLFLCFSYGQTSLITSAILLFGLRKALVNPVVAGAILALLVCKPQVGLIVPAALIGLHAWRTFISTAAFAIIYICASLAVVGPEPWRLFFEITLPQQAELFAAAFFDRTMLYSPTFVLRDLGLSPEAAMAMQGILSFGVMAVLIMSLRRTEDFDLKFLLIALGALLVSPYMQTYELPLLGLAVGRLVLAAPCRHTLSSASFGFVLAASTVGAFLALAVVTKSGVNVLSPLLLITFLAVAGERLVRQGANGPAILAPV